MVATPALSFCHVYVCLAVVDEERLPWEVAEDITRRTVAYTNHTIMAEALECWQESLIKQRIPRIYQIIKEIDRRQRIFLGERFGGDMGKIDYMSVISNGNVNMANLCLTACHSINGVAALHTEILKKHITLSILMISLTYSINSNLKIHFQKRSCHTWLMKLSIRK